MKISNINGLNQQNKQMNSIITLKLEGHNCAEAVERKFSAINNKGLHQTT